jgi:hypothetical protein
VYAFPGVNAGSARRLAPADIRAPVARGDGLRWRTGYRPRSHAPPPWPCAVAGVIAYTRGAVGRVCTRSRVCDAIAYFDGGGSASLRTGLGARSTIAYLRFCEESECTRFAVRRRARSLKPGAAGDLPGTAVALPPATGQPHSPPPPASRLPPPASRLPPLSGRPPTRYNSRLPPRGIHATFNRAIAPRGRTQPFGDPSWRTFRTIRIPRTYRTS